MALTPLCLDCEQALDLSNPAYAACVGCGRAYPQVLGIPDLRGSQASDSPLDQTIVAQMAAQFLKVDFGGLLDIRLIGAASQGELLEQQVGYILNQDQRGRAMLDMFLERLRQHFQVGGNETALDIGCGRGASLLALARRFKQVVGIDPSLPELILARKALEEAGISNVQLIQAYGQRIAYPDRSFDYVNALNVLEHVFNLEGVLGECYRLLKPGGGFAADSRNRYDLFLPEPHVRVRWVGWAPRRWAKAYVRWRKGVSYDFTYLLSYWNLKHGLGKYFGRKFRIVFPWIEAYGGPAWLDRWLARLERLPLLSNLALWFFPSHLALAQR